MEHIIISSGDSDRAPEVENIHTGPLGWSGKSFLDLTEEEIHEVCEFAETHGRNIAIQDGIIGRTTNNPFHNDFLGGVPQAMWKFAYRRGATRVSTMNYSFFRPTVAAMAAAMA